MTQEQIRVLTDLVDQATAARPTASPDAFMQELWRPFIHSLPASDRRMAWQVYLKAQAKHFHALVEHLQTLPPEKLRLLKNVLDKLPEVEASMQHLSEAKAVA